MNPAQVNEFFVILVKPRNGARDRVLLPWPVAPCKAFVFAVE